MSNLSHADRTIGNVVALMHHPASASTECRFHHSDCVRNAPISTAISGPKASSMSSCRVLGKTAADDIANRWCVEPLSSAYQQCHPWAVAAAAAGRALPKRWSSYVMCDSDPTAKAFAMFDISLVRAVPGLNPYFPERSAFARTGNTSRTVEFRAFRVDPKVKYGYYVSLLEFLRKRADTADALSIDSAQALLVQACSRHTKGSTSLWKQQIKICCKIVEDRGMCE